MKNLLFIFYMHIVNRVLKTDEMNYFIAFKSKRTPALVARPTILLTLLVALVVEFQTKVITYVSQRVP